MFKLVIQDDEGKTTVVPLIRDEITIGRKEGNTIRLTERNVSRRHARILRNNGEVQIEDLGSYNGIRVNNARIAERVSLRVSDQVQIGDYKLYLKAEGVEQVDDARTMPIERIDAALPTEVMPAMAPTTQPMPAQTPVIAPTPAPNRSAVAVADTDPAGRPIATAAQVAAMTAPVGYGKLVCVSSNFAGKEFDLTRPQMIIGRTDENDIVINHRSISRNHAKITRDPETGRYTISDLQSSNGVRVNGQDYGKVELRRGDTVDLGHVRLRFVEPGEDFVFARDAVIADVPEAAGKRGLLVAVLLSVLVIGGVGAYFVLRDKDEGKIANENTNGQNGTGTAGDTVATAPTPPTPPPGTPDPNNAGTAVVTPPDTTQPAVKPSSDTAATKLAECEGFAAQQQWTDARKCAEGLERLDPANGKALAAKYKSELENDLSEGRVADAVGKKDLKGAKKALADIERDSYYRARAAKMVDDLNDYYANQYLSKARADKAKGRCELIDRHANDARDKGVESVSDILREKSGCTPAGGSSGGGDDKPDCSQRMVDKSSACRKQFCNKNPGDAQCGGGPSEAPCDAEALKEKGLQNVNIGQHAAALGQFEQSLKCKREPYVVQLAFMASCNSGNSPKAKVYFKQLTPAQQQKYAQICIRYNVPYQ